MYELEICFQDENPYIPPRCKRTEFKTAGVSIVPNSVFLSDTTEVPSGYPILATEEETGSTIKVLRPK